MVRPIEEKIQELNKEYGVPYYILLNSYLEARDGYRKNNNPGREEDETKYILEEMDKLKDGSWKKIYENEGTCKDG